MVLCRCVPTELACLHRMGSSRPWLSVHRRTRISVVRFNGPPTLSPGRTAVKEQPPMKSVQPSTLHGAPPGPVIHRQLVPSKAHLHRRGPIQSRPIGRHATNSADPPGTRQWLCALAAHLRPSSPRRHVSKGWILETRCIFRRETTAVHRPPADRNRTVSRVVSRRCWIPRSDASPSWMRSRLIFVHSAIALATDRKASW